MEIKWHDALKEKPGKYQRVLIKLTSGEIVSAEYEPDEKEKPYYETEFPDIDGNYETDEYLVEAWAKCPHSNEIRKEVKDATEKENT